MMLSANEIKQRVSEEAVKLVKPGMTIGIGTGSTVHYFIEELGKKVKSGLKFTAVPTSLQTLMLAKQQGIDLLELNEVPAIDLTIDSADEIDRQLQLIKGGGGALLQEKMVAAASNELVIIADNSKLKTILGHFPLPVEVVPYGWKQVQKKIAAIYQVKAELRIIDKKPYLTDHGHYILDCHFQQITNAPALNSSLHLIPGIVETGLFINMSRVALIGQPDGSVLKIEAGQ